MTRRLRLWQDRVQTDVEILGSGPPLIFLHGPWGLPSDLPFVERLAESHTVYAPRHPGTTPGDPDAIHQVDTLLDLVVYHSELFERLELHRAPIVGHSVGGMLACELAAALPASVDGLVLIAPVGLWRDDQPVRNWLILSDQERRTALFAEPDGPAAEHFFTRSADPEAQANFIWAQACTAKFTWPVPDKGLNHRIHRISAPTLIVWGSHDSILRPVYADEFAERIAGAHVERLEAAGHMPHLEQPEAVQRLIRDFCAWGG